MKTTVLLLSAFMITMQLSANSFYEQLCKFNFNWRNYASYVPMNDVKTFASDKEYVQAHLGTVLPILENASANGLSEEQIHSRKQMIQWLTEYREQGNFPQNYYCKERIPVFIDEHGTHCAVGYLMQQSGEEEMAQRISNNYQYNWLKDIKDENLAAWQLASGLSMDELKLIQGAYDSYAHNAFILPNRIEIPQKPEVITAYFDKGGKTESNIWVKGEGTGKLLNGKWIQNYSASLPWIEGYYEKGKRTGLWKEYYQGTKQLCRTENWRNDKLNGIRKRYNKSGQLTEEILFKNGKAELKTNYELSTGLKYVRKQLDSLMVYTEVYTLEGLLLATGNERIYNPGNLQWFQNIELTALNTFAVTASRQGATTSSSSYQSPSLYNTPPLVEYKKEGTWKYYREYNYTTPQQKALTVFTKICTDYYHFGSFLANEITYYDKIIISDEGYDSISIEYKNNLLQDFYGYSKPDFIHLKIVYGPDKAFFSFYNKTELRIRARVIGEYTKDGKKKGEWRHYDEYGMLYKIENFIIPKKEEELVTGF